MINVKLKDITLNITDGKHGDCDGEEKSGYYFISCKDVYNGSVHYEGARQITEKDYIDTHRRTMLEPNDILVTNSGTIGRMALVKDIPETYRTTFQKSVAIVKPNQKIIRPAYLYYCLLNCGTQFINQSNGSAQKNLLLGTMRNFELSIEEEFARQDIMVEMLKAYDDLIENNQKQIKLLEEAAQRLYKEWFVDLRFPGYEDVAVVDGVPEGWTRKTVLECLEMHIGGGWGKETAIGKNTIPGKVIRGTDINDIKAGNFNDVPLRYHTENDRKKRALQACDIVFELSNGNINNIGRSLLIDNLILQSCGESTICASFCKLFRPIDKLHALMLYWEIQEMQTSGRMMPFKKQGSNGINNFAFEDFLTHELLIPNNEALLLPIENIMKKTSNIQRQFALLSQARDRLLPKLMSGELEV